MTKNKLNLKPLYKQMVREQQNHNYKITSAKNVILIDGSYTERIVGYDFVKGAYIVVSDTTDFYTIEELQERFELPEDVVDQIEKMFD
jgi:hypothetical protein